MTSSTSPPTSSATRSPCSSTGSRPSAASPRRRSCRCLRTRTPRSSASPPRRTRRSVRSASLASSTFSARALPRRKPPPSCSTAAAVPGANAPSGTRTRNPSRRMACSGSCASPGKIEAIIMTMAAQDMAKAGGLRVPCIASQGELRDQIVAPPSARLNRILNIFK
ncbi:hypothetical protein T492DRAFT_984784 [Pavlovales sp. CCMP2436]|nr:hypothetical protein T492DRAFT_984784 [Pavlovales sp. CCMP2436]